MSGANVTAKRKKSKKLECEANRTHVLDSEVLSIIKLSQNRHLALPEAQFTNDL